MFQLPFKVYGYSEGESKQQAVLMYSAKRSPDGGAFYEKHSKVARCMFFLALQAWAVCLVTCNVSRETV